MVIKYLMDENVAPVYATQLRRRQPDLVIRAVGEPDTPSRSTLDPEILLWCEEHRFITEPLGWKEGYTEHYNTIQIN
jgi:hypothetical protein